MREEETGGSRVISRCLSPPGYLPPCGRYQCRHAFQAHGKVAQFLYTVPGTRSWWLAPGASQATAPHSGGWLRPDAFTKVGVVSKGTQRFRGLGSGGMRCDGEMGMEKLNTAARNECPQTIPVSSPCKHLSALLGLGLGLRRKTREFRLGPPAPGHWGRTVYLRYLRNLRWRRYSAVRTSLERWSRIPSRGEGLGH